jgi:integrase
MATGITKRHARSCRSREGGRCNCRPSHMAWVWSERDGRKIYKTIRLEAEAKTWRADALSALSKGAMRAPKPTIVKQAWDAWHEGAKAGTIRNRSGNSYKPSAVRSYERAMRLRVLPEIGSTRVSDLRRPDLQDFADKLLADGLNPSTIQCTFLPLRAIYRRALARGNVAVNPCNGLELPAIRSPQRRFASPQEAEALLGALAETDRPIWATALYAGLRHGELRALRFEDVDMTAGLLRLRHGWDQIEGEIALKSHEYRNVPIPAILREYLARHQLRAGRREGLLFGRTASDPFVVRAVTDRADTAWKAAGLKRITLHECRHTFASLMIAAGVNAKALQTYMGHASIKITLDLYGHLMPGNEDEAAGLLDGYLTAQRKRADEQARSASGAQTGAHDLEKALEPLA